MKNPINDTRRNYKRRIIITMSIVLCSLSIFCKLPSQYTAIVLFNDIVIKNTLYRAPLIILCPGDDCFQQSPWATEDTLWSRTYILEDDNDSNEMFGDAIDQILNKEPETQHFYTLYVRHKGNFLIDYGYYVTDEEICNITRSEEQLSVECSSWSDKSE